MIPEVAAEGDGAAPRPPACRPPRGVGTTGRASRRGSRARTPLRWDGRRREDGAGFRVLAVETEDREGGRKQDDKEWKRERSSTGIIPGRQAGEHARCEGGGCCQLAGEEGEQFVRTARGVRGLGPGRERRTSLKLKRARKPDGRF
jgi:hypothetical protein